jgi:phage protein D
VPPVRVYSANIFHNRYEHQVAVLNFKDWGISSDAVSSGSPINFTLEGSYDTKDFYGYVHHIKVKREPGAFFTEVVAIGASYAMKQQSQQVYNEMSADLIIKTICDKYNFSCFAQPHPRIYDQVSQAGHTDWQLMVRLAKQSGYSLRTENTEVYFQPLLYDYTNYRAEAPTFYMNPEYSVKGSTLYSFKPLIGESIQYDEDIKSAVAISGVDKVSKSAVSITKQKRNKKTRKQSTVEHFDKFESLVVAPDPLIAKYESDAAEDRNNTFPYRATAEVLGEPTLRPDLPVYFEGLGDGYSGYWTILGVEHKLLETERNSQTYTTVLTVGTDSLGSAAPWSDNTTVSTPDARPKRTIIPNVKQTNVKPKTKLANSKIHPTPQAKGSFGKISNRSKPLVNKQMVKASTWKTQTKSLSKVIPTQAKSAAVIKIVANKKAAAR